ncbi:MAG: hypothetical protein H6Q80_394 [Deltaproteobacteria bacterium]|jgi:hypothetical protein|nr:hypothetical protein [Deltaproteobacteria bacterium]
MGSLSNLHGTRKNHSGRQVCMVTDLTVMINRNPCVHDGIYSDPASGLDHCACHHLRAFLQYNIRSDHGGRMNHYFETESGIPETLVNRPSPFRGANGAHSVYQQDCRRVPSENILVIADYRNPENFMVDLCWIRVDNTENHLSLEFQGLDGDLCMAARSDDDHWKIP